MDIHQIVTVVITNGTGAICSAFVIWLCWYRETKTTPQMIEAFTKSIGETRECYQRWHDENRERLETIQFQLQEIKTLSGMEGARKK